MVKTKGSWVTFNTPARKIRVTPFSTTQKLMLMLVCLLEKFACIQEHFSFCAIRPSSLHFTLGYSLGFLWVNTSFSMWDHLSLYILHIKYIKMISLFLEHFQCWSKKSVDQKNLFQQAHRVFISCCYLCNQKPKMLTKDIISEFVHFTSHSEFK